ncbi:MAG: phytanoyl-CoA dioxygenase family protein [Acidimicrobiales bacterium]
MRFSPLDRYVFDCRGWVLFEDVVAAAEVAELRDAIAARQLPRAGATVDQQRFGEHGELLGWHEGFRALIDHPLVLDSLRQLVGPTARLDHSYGIVMRPGTSGLGLHGPVQPFDPSQFYVHRGGQMWNGMVAFSWALTDARPGDGGFGCISGSHRAEEPLPPGAERIVEEVPQRAGSLVVFTEALFHCTVPWNGQEDRYSLLFKYCPGNSAWARRPPAPPDVVAMLSDRQRVLVEPPAVEGHPPLPAPGPERASSLWRSRKAR